MKIEKTNNFNRDVTREVGLTSDERLKKNNYKLYCYYNIDDLNNCNGIKSIIEGRFYYSKASLFNDPFDCVSASCFNYDLDRNKIGLDDEEALSKIKKQNDYIVHYIKNNYKIACFSEIPDNILMWSHYGRKHTGICIEYDFRNFYERNQNQNSFPSLALIYPVKYDERRPVLSDHLQKQILDTNRKSALCINPFDIVPILCLKSPSWSYEKEWRIVINDICNKCDYSNIDITKVYLGLNISGLAEAIIRKLATEKNIPVVKYKMSDEIYKLEEISTTK